MLKKLSIIFVVLAGYILLGSCADYNRQRGGMSDKEAAGITQQLKKEMGK